MVSSGQDDADNPSELGAMLLEGLVGLLLHVGDL